MKPALTFLSSFALLHSSLALASDWPQFRGPNAFAVSTAKTLLSFVQGSGHGGSHPHLAHEFAMALTEGRDPFPNAKQSANWTCVGLCAHESAMAGGKIVKLPAFTV